MVNDILVEQALAVLVAESPHHVELATKIPLSGHSGRVIGRALMDIDSPIGFLCHEGQAKMSIVNTFCQPLKFDIEGFHRPAFMKQLNSLKYENKTSYKKEIKHILQECHEMQQLEDYGKRLLRALSTTSDKKLVVCGLIAQSVLEWTFGVNERMTRFAEPFSCQLESNNVKVFYMWHPSPISGEEGTSAWELSCNSPQICGLKKFIFSEESK
jgi:hypothetical protein